MAKQPLEQLFLRDHVNGIMHENIVDEFKVPTNSVNEAINVHFDVMGAVQSRQGTTQLGDTLTGNILGLHQFLDEGTGTDDQIVVVNGTVLRNLVGSTWTSKLTGLTSGSKARFTNFTDRMLMVNGQQAPAGWDGSGSAFDTTNLVSAPTGNFIDNFRSRVWIANTDANPSRLFYTIVVSSTGEVTWDTVKQFIDISPGDGEDITGIKRSPRSLLVFKPSHMYRVFDINEVDPDPQINVGTYSQESIVEAKDGIYFHDWNNSAIFKYSNAIPIELSKPIKPFLEGVTLANRSDVTGWSDSDHVYEAVGDIILNGVTFTNITFVYTISTQVWTIYSHPTQFRASTQYDDGSVREPVVGGSNGEVYRFNNGLDDNGTPITFSLVTKWHDLSGVRAYQDTIELMAVLHRNAQGANLQYQVNIPVGESDWESIGQLETSPATIFNTDITGNRMRFRLSGTSSGEPFIYQGLEILKSFTEEVVE